MNRLKLFSYALLIIGISLILLGTRWMIVNEPWMLDEVANVERLGMTFDDLFEQEINTTLPDYLRKIYLLMFIVLFILIIFIKSCSFIEKVRIK